MDVPINTVEELIHILKAHPEWRQRVIHALFNGNEPAPRDAIDRLAEQVRILTIQVQLLTERMDRYEQRTDERFNQIDERFKKVDERFNQIDERFNQIDERFKQVDERFNQIDERFKQVDERFNQIDERFNQFEQQTNERFNQIDERFNQIDERFNQIDERFKKVERDIQKLNDQVGAVRGETLELRYRNHIGNFFGRVLRRVRVVDIRSLEEDLETKLADEAFEQLLNLDVIVAGKVKNQMNRPEVWAAVEISATINTNDVTRARQRADILCQAGYPTVAVAGGEECALDAIALAQQTNVVVIQDGGTMTGWDEAFAIVSHMLEGTHA